MGLKDFARKLKLRMNKDVRKNYITYKIPKRYYKELIKEDEIEKIIKNIPPNLSKLEKAYYVYIELGRIVNESKKFVFSAPYKKDLMFLDKMDNDFVGICKSISELYVSILRDKRVGISADLIKQFPEFKFSHIDVLLKIDGKRYLVNLISDLSRIKTLRRLNGFGIDLKREYQDEFLELKNLSYLYKLEKYYGEIDDIPREELERMDKKLGYSLSVPGFMKKSEKGIYTDDTIELLQNEFRNSELFKEYVLHGKEVPKEELLKLKLDYIIENIDKFTEYSGRRNYLDIIRYYYKIAEKVLNYEEMSRIQAYVATVDGDLDNIISIIKLKPMSQSTNNNVYYMYSNEDKKYIEKSPEEMKKYLDQFDRNSLKIIGVYDKFKKRDIDELELY